MSMELLSNGLYSASQDDEKEVVYEVLKLSLKLFMLNLQNELL